MGHLLSVPLIHSPGWACISHPGPALPSPLLWALLLSSGAGALSPSFLHASLGTFLPGKAKLIHWESPGVGGQFYPLCLWSRSVVFKSLALLALFCSVPVAETGRRVPELSSSREHCWVTLSLPSCQGNVHGQAWPPCGLLFPAKLLQPSACLLEGRLVIYSSNFQLPVPTAQLEQRTVFLVMYPFLSPDTAQRGRVLVFVWQVLYTYGSTL